MAVARPLPRRLPRPQRDAIPLADGNAFRDYARRHAIIRLLLGAALVGVLVLAFAAARRLPAAPGDGYGLVLFSDDAYEAMPPGMSSAQLEPLMRFYKLPKGRELNPPLTPWSYDFRGGTRISAGMQMALDILRRDHVKKGAL